MQIKKIFKNYLLALIISIFLWNIIIGVFIYNQVDKQIDSFGGGKIPNTKIVWGKEGFGSCYTDNLGFNNDYINEKKGKKYRIVVLGDSFTEAMHVNRDDNYISLLSEKLNKNSDNFEVYNLGISGRSIADYIGFANDYLNKLSPDLVVVQVRVDDFQLNTNCDFYKIVKNEGSYKTEKCVRGNQMRDKFKILRDNSGWFRPIIGYSFMRLEPSIKSVILFKSKIMKFFNNQDFVGAEKNKNKNNNKTNEDFIAWQLEKMKEKYEDNLVFLNISMVPVINNNEVVLHEKEDKSFLKKIINDESKKRNINLLDTEEEFITYFKENNELPFGFYNTKPGTGHLNEGGHKIIANMLYDFLSKNKLNKK